MCTDLKKIKIKKSVPSDLHAEIFPGISHVTSAQTETLASFIKKLPKFDQPTQRN